MKLGAIGPDIWRRLESGERLTKDQEKIVRDNIKAGDLQDVPTIVRKLRENSQHFQQKSAEEVVKAVDSLRKIIMLYDANNAAEKAIVSEWKGALTNAQANRIENEASRQEAAQKSALMSQEAAKQQRAAEEAAKAQARAQAAAATHHAVVQQALRTAINPPPPVRPPALPVGHAAQQGAQMAMRVGINPPPRGFPRARL